MIFIGETHLESDVNAGAHQKQFKHEVVEGLHEEFAIWCADGRVLFVSSEVLHALF